MATRSRRRPLHLEPLGDRTVPAIIPPTLDPITHILTVTGDEADDTVTIFDGGQLGGVTIVADGQTWQFDDEVRVIQVNTGLGNDVVTYNLTEPLSALRLVTVELGRGADVFDGNLAGKPLVPGGYLGLSVYGQGGGDTLTLNAVATDVDPAATLNVYFEGAGGKDGIAFNTLPDLLNQSNVLLKKDQRR